MTEPSFDELASAHLDGATTPEEAAQVEADPALMARVEELRQVRAEVAAVPPADPVQREAAIAAALAAFDDDEAPGAPIAPASPLAGAPRRRASPTAVRVLGAAAAIAVLALLVPLLGRLAQSDDEDTASFDSSSSAIEAAPDRQGEVTGDGGDTTTTVPAMLGRDLGTFDDLAALVAAVSQGVPETAFDATEDATAGQERTSTCPPVTVGASADEMATATVSGDAVIAVVRETGTEARTLLVYRLDDCALLAELPL